MSGLWANGAPLKPTAKVQTGDFSEWGADGIPLLTPLTSVPLTETATGSQVAVETGSVTVNVGVEFTVTGSEVTIQTGTISVAIGANASVTGSEVTLEIGDVGSLVSIPVDVSVTGSEVSLETGDVEVEATVNAVISSNLGREVLVETGSVTITGAEDIIDWPDHLPVPLKLHRRPVYPRHYETQMDSQRIRKRPQFTEIFETIESVWDFTLDEFNTFRNFVHDTIVNGTLQFRFVGAEPSTDPDVENILVRYTVKFMPAGVYSVARSDNLYIISATLEIIGTETFAEEQDRVVIGPDDSVTIGPGGEVVIG